MGYEIVMILLKMCVLDTAGVGKTLVQ